MPDERLTDALAILTEAVDADTEYWTETATGQNSDEAEYSGWLIGYRDCLEALTSPNPTIFDGIVKIIAGEAAERRAETAEYLTTA